MPRRTSATAIEHLARVDEPRARPSPTCTPTTVVVLRPSLGVPLPGYRTVSTPPPLSPSFSLGRRGAVPPEGRTAAPVIRDDRHLGSGPFAPLRVPPAAPLALSSPMATGLAAPRACTHARTRARGLPRSVRPRAGPREAPRRPRVIPSVTPTGGCPTRPRTQPRTPRH